MAEWFYGEIGRQGIWICPSAPFRVKTVPTGNLETAWDIADWWKWFGKWHGPSPPTAVESRAGSYDVNFWLFGRPMYNTYSAPSLLPDCYSREAQFAQPLWTPILADGV